MSEFFAALSTTSPAFVILAAGILAMFIPSVVVRKVLMIAAPLIAGAIMLTTPSIGSFGTFDVAGFTLETYRYDELSRVWGLIFVLIAFLNAIYSVHERSQMSDAAALLYSGAAIGAVFAGDLLTLFFFWELTALASVFLIFAAGGSVAYRAGLRYLAIQVLSGVLLLGGAAVWAQTQGWAFNEIGLDSLAGRIILIGFGIKAGFPLVHMWINDAYPKASATGAVVLSAFTTKLAIYVLARAYAGEDILIVIGAVMAVFPAIFILFEDDMRRCAAYALNSTLGFMVVGVGIGTEKAIAAVAANAFVGVIYIALMFMVLGAVMAQTGTARASQLGGLYRRMPLTALFGVIAALALAAAPAFSGFVAKALTLSAVLGEHRGDIWFALVFGSAGVLAHAALKIPYLVFFGPDRGPDHASTVREAPPGMLIAMAMASALCLYLGVDYQLLYSLLPGDVAYAPYTLGHILGQAQLLFMVAFAFALVLALKLYPARQPISVRDVDWLYRGFGDGAVRWATVMTIKLIEQIQRGLGIAFSRFGRRLFHLFSPGGALARTVPSGLMAIWTTVILALILIVAYFSPA
jgi:multicomponent Na+:H+ antiporter subunit D